MIYDRFDNLTLYADRTPLHKALVYARDVAADVPDGRIEIDGERLYASVAGYETGGRDGAPLRSAPALHRRPGAAGGRGDDRCRARRRACPVLEAYDDDAGRDVPEAPGARRLAADAARLVCGVLPARRPPPRVPFEGQAESAQDRHESGRRVNGRRLP